MFAPYLHSLWHFIPTKWRSYGDLWRHFTPCIITSLGMRLLGCRRTGGTNDHHSSNKAHCAHFYRAMLCIRGTSHGPASLCLSVRLSVRPSVTSRSSTNNTTRQSRDSSFLKQKISAKFDRGHHYTGAPNAGGVGQNRRLLTNNGLYLENGTRQTHGFY